MHFVCARMHTSSKSRNLLLTDPFLGTVHVPAVQGTRTIPRHGDLSLAWAAGSFWKRDE